MEAPETISSDSHINFAYLPDVPFLRVLNYLPGAEIERCREISALFYKRIDQNRKSLQPVEVVSMEIEYPGHEYPDESDRLNVEVGLSINIRRDEEMPRWPGKKNFKLREALELMDYTLPRMAIEGLHLNRLDDFTFHHLLGKFTALNVKCEILYVRTSPGLGLDDLRPMIFCLEPKNLSLKVCAFNNETFLTSEFLHEKCIRDRQQLHIEAYPESYFDDQVLLNLNAPVANIEGLSTCTFDGIASFLKEWKAGNREIAMIKFRISSSELDINELIAILPWNIPAIEPESREVPVYLFEFKTEVENLLQKKINLSIRQNTLNDSFSFELVDVDLPTGYTQWMPQNDAQEEDDYSHEWDDEIDYDSYDHDYDYENANSDFYDEYDEEEDQFGFYQPVEDYEHPEEEPQIRLFMNNVELGGFPNLQIQELALHSDHEGHVDHVDIDDFYDQVDEDYPDN